MFADPRREQLLREWHSQHDFQIATLAGGLLDPEMVFPARPSRASIIVMPPSAQSAYRIGFGGPENTQSWIGLSGSVQVLTAQDWPGILASQIWVLPQGAIGITLIDIWAIP